MPFSPALKTGLMIAATLALAACGNGESPNGMPPVQVSTLTLQPERAAVVNELPGRLNPTREAEVRARVAGIVLERVFTEGRDVEAGDLLFRIDPAPFQAELDAARAALEQAEADAFQAAALARRYEPLVEANAVSRQEFDRAQAADRQARAAVSAARARVQTAQINLGHARVTAPISGRIGRALVTEGALVGQGAATPLAHIRQLDPMYADFSQSTAELARLQRAFADGAIARVDPDTARVELVLEDGSVYPHAGRLLFSDISVDPGTGQVALRGEFPNPTGDLLPGSYVRVRLEQASAGEALLVPKQSVQRNAGGQTYVTVVEAAVGEDGQPVAGHDGQPARVAAHRVVRLGTSLGNRWLVEDGLAAGDEVVVEGFQRAAPGMPVIAQPWTGHTAPAAPGEAPEQAQPGVDAAADPSDPADDEA